MTTAIVKLDGSELHIRKCIRDMKDRAKVMVRGKKVELFIEVPESEVGWVEKVATDLNLKTNMLPTLPPYKVAPCGIKTTDLLHHQLRCKKCEQALSNSKDNAPGKVTLQHVEHPHIDSTPIVNGVDIPTVISVMKQKMEECMTLAADYDTGVKVLESMMTADKRLAELRAELTKSKEVLATFLK